MYTKIIITLFCVLVSSMSYGAVANTMLVESASAKIFTVVYPRQHAETVILLHGGPGVPMDFSPIAE